MDKQQLLVGVDLLEKNFTDLFENALTLASAVMQESYHNYNPNDLDCKVCQALRRVFELKKNRDG